MRKVERKLRVDHTYLMFDPGDVLRSTKGGYVRVLGHVVVSDPSDDGKQHTHVEMTVEDCDRPSQGLFVVGVLRE